MLKNFSKFLLIMLVIFAISTSSSMCLADEEANHEHSNTTTETNEGTVSTSDATDTQTHTGDLYVFDNNIVMDKYVDGNVFLFGNNIEITGKVNGNLFAFGNNVKFNESIVRYSIFVCANSVYYNGGCGTSSDYGNLYVAALNFETTYNSFVTGDVKSVSSSVIFKSAVYRNIDLKCNTINLGSGEDIPLIFGDFNYSANKEIEIPENAIAGEGTVTYTSPYNLENILLGFGSCIVTSLALYIILTKLSSKFLEKLYDNKFSIRSLLKSFAIGLASIVIVTIFLILLAGSLIGVSLAIILALLFAILYIIGIPMLAIKITNTLKPALRIEKTSMFYLVIILVITILHSLTLIPFVGSLLGIIINITSIGIIVSVFLPHKELSEEKLSLQEDKKQAKEKKKKEKIESKNNKKDKKTKNKTEKQTKEINKN